MATPVSPHPVVVLKLPTQVKSLIAYAQNIASAITQNPSFPSPNPPLATFLSDLAALNAAESAVLSRTKGAVEIRNAKLAVVRNDLGNLKAYVQSVASAGAAENAPQVIASAAMAVRKTTLHDKAALLAKQGSVSGTVNLVAKSAAPRAAYEWQYSLDQKTWTTLPLTLQAKTGVSGLTAGSTYYFRVQSVIPTGVENWSQVVSLVVT
jgi:hypothetical protein